MASGLLTKARHAWLFSAMGTASPSTPSSYKHLRSHSASLVTMAAPTYSASAVDVAGVDWRILVYDIVPPLRVKTKRVVDR